MTTQLCVYQAFDKRGGLLYVGLSRNWARRWVGHAQKQPWWKAVSDLEVTWFEHRAEAFWYEGFLIRTASPRHNKRVPPETAAPSTLGTYCPLCGTGYSIDCRPIGTRCDDMSRRLDDLRPGMTEEEMMTLACPGHCQLDTRTTTPMAPLLLTRTGEIISLPA